MEHRPDKASYKQSFYVKGMTCVTCVKHVERAIKKVEGVYFVSVNLATESGFALSEQEINFDRLKKAVSEVGYEIAESVTPDAAKKRYQEAGRNLFLSWMATFPLMVWMLLHMSGYHLPIFRYLEPLMAAFVIFYTGRHTIKGAWIALIHAHFNMDTLIFLGSVTAFSTTLLALLGLKIASFGSIGAMIVAIHLTGRYIESWLRDRAAKDVKALLQLQAKEARVRTSEGWVLIPIVAVKIDSVIQVLPSERIPLDGEVAEGTSSVDESMITGESMPLKKQTGSRVTGGSLNLNAPLTVRVTEVGEDLFLSQLISMIQEAQGTKVPIQALADRITLWFVPTVLLLALSAALIWFFGFESLQPALESLGKIIPWVNAHADALSHSLFVFVATLVIACPCALGLAIPMALIGASSLSAKKGLIIRNGEAIQTAGEIRTVITDKTGTLTLGKPTVIETTVPDTLLPAIAGLETQSAHPLAKALVEFAKGNGSVNPADIEDVQETPGEGISGRWENQVLFVGKPIQYDIYHSWTEKGYSIAEARLDEEIQGAFAVADPLREDTIPGIAALRAMGLTVILATGDHFEAAKRVSKETGISDFKSQMKPSEKLALIHEHHRGKGKVLMVGDGLNDGPALKAADIGIAMGSGTDLAIDSADIVIVRGGIPQVVESLKISRLAFRIIKQNLIWAFLYNVIAIPAAMLGILHPAIGEIAMAFSSITVILNSLRLKYHRE